MVFSKYKVSIFLLIVLLSVLTSCGRPNGSADNKSTQKIVIAEPSRSEYWLPVYLAQALGYLKEEGLEAEFVAFKGGPLVIASLLAGESQFALTGYEQVMKTSEKGKSTKMIVTTTARHPWSLVAGKNIKNFSDLKGKTISAGMPGASPRAFVRACLKYGGLDPDKDIIYTDLPAGSEISAYEKGDISGFYGSGRSKFELLKRGSSLLVDLSEPEQHRRVLQSDSYHLYVVQVTDSFIKEHPETVQKFTNAVVKAMDWQNSHQPEEIAKAVSPLFPDAGNEMFLQSVKDALRTQSPDGYFTRQGHDAAVRLSLDVGMIEKPLPMESVVDQSFLIKAYEKHGKK